MSKFRWIPDKDDEGDWLMPVLNYKIDARLADLMSPEAMDREVEGFMAQTIWPPRGKKCDRR